MNTRYLMLACVLAATPGCSSLWMNQGKLVSVLAAGQVGMFRRQTGQWPLNKSQLVGHGCRDLDAYTEDSASSGDWPETKAPGCQFFLRLPYQLDLTPSAANVRMVLRDPAGKLVCDLLVIVPANDGRDALSPQIMMRTTLLGCPGEGKSL